MFYVVNGIDYMVYDLWDIVCKDKDPRVHGFWNPPCNGP